MASSLVALLAVAASAACAQATAPRPPPSPLPTYQFPERQLRYDPALPRPAPPAASAERIVVAVPCDERKRLIAVAETGRPLSPSAARVVGLAYEEGHCVERDWPKAERFLGGAAKAGDRAAASALAAGYARPGNTQDHAAALWWAHRAEMPLPGECRVMGFKATMAIDDFVGDLQTMPTERLKACVYNVAVTGALLPGLNLVLLLAGPTSTAVDFQYTPENGRYWVGLVNAAGERQVFEGLATDSNPRPVSIPKAAALKVQEVLKRLPPPAGLPPEWAVGVGIRRVTVAPPPPVQASAADAGAERKP